MTKSNILWTEEVWNPVVGCSKESEGCKNCYAEPMARRLKAMGNPQYQDVVTDEGKWTGVCQLGDEKKLFKPLRKNKPTTYFVNSMGDLFHKNVPDEWIDRVFAVMGQADKHRFIVCTKRPEAMRDYLGSDASGTIAHQAGEMFGAEANPKVFKFWEEHGQDFADCQSWPLPNVVLMVTAENQAMADERITLLLDTPAAEWWVSYEPALGALDLRGWLGCKICRAPHFYATSTYTDTSGIERFDLCGCPVNILDLVIAGGESGPGARPTHPQNFRDIRDQCKEARVAFLFKQRGGWTWEEDGIEDIDCPTNPNPPLDWRDKPDRYLYLKPDGSTGSGYALDGGVFVEKVGKKKAGRLLDGREHNGEVG